MQRRERTHDGSRGDWLTDRSEYLAGFDKKKKLMRLAKLEKKKRAEQEHRKDKRRQVLPLFAAHPKWLLLEETASEAGGG